ncbi:uncharacterized protein LOC121918296, partial [Sceloporus undulatus]|uniref:uncharacterized protein LOC121918296 n=1 Tax=Sceloporus undulatus TaxID=8520 RepID=UPI001C4B8677
MPRQRSLWTDGEVQCLFHLLEMNEGLDIIMRSTSHPNRAIYGKIARRMRRHGFQKTTEQVASKVKVMRTAFYRAMGQHGEDPEAQQKPAYFEKMWYLWMLAGGPSLDIFDVAARRGRHARRSVQIPPRRSDEQDSASSPHSPESDVEEAPDTPPLCPEAPLQAPQAKAPSPEAPAARTPIPSPSRRPDEEDNTSPLHSPK